MDKLNEINVFDWMAGTLNTMKNYIILLEEDVKKLENMILKVKVKKE